MNASFYFGWEAELIILIQSVMGPFWISVMSIITLFGEETLLIILLGYLYWGREKKLGERVCITLLLTATVNPVLKNIFLRLRPYFVIDTVRCLNPVEKGDIYDVLIQGYSFPSGHTASAAATYGSLAVNSKKRGLKTALLMLIPGVGISRFSLGVHYPTDVIAGAALGLISILLVSRISSDRNDKTFFITLIVLCAPGLMLCSTEDFFTCYGIMCGGLLGILYERSSVQFSCTDSILITVTRIFCGTAVFMSVVNLLKLPLILLDQTANERVVLCYRTVRYAAATFAAIGLFPHLFSYIDRIFEKD